MEKNIAFGKVWKAVKDYRITEPYSEQYNCVIPKNTRVVVLHTPRRDSGALGFDIMPLTSKGLDKKLVPNLKQMELNKEGFGIIVLFRKFEEYFVLDEDQEIAFDNTDATEFWQKIVMHVQ
jgi:hypothetical protein